MGAGGWVCGAAASCAEAEQVMAVAVMRARRRVVGREFIETSVGFNAKWVEKLLSRAGWRDWEKWGTAAETGDVWAEMTGGGNGPGTMVLGKATFWRFLCSLGEEEFVYGAYVQN